MRSAAETFIFIFVALAGCSSTPDPVNVAHCVEGTQAERYDCVFNAHTDRIQSLYARHFSDEKNPKGRVILVLSITRDGSVAESHIGKSTMNNISFEKDLLSYVSTMKFGMGMAQYSFRVFDFPMAH